MDKINGASDDAYRTVGSRLAADRRVITRIAYRPSKRLRMLDSPKADRIAGRPELLYTGAELRKPR